MKQDKIKEYKSKSDHELRSILFALREKKSQIEYDMRAGKKSDINALRKAKKEIAFILTLINQHGK